MIGDELMALQSKLMSQLAPEKENENVDGEEEEEGDEGEKEEEGGHRDSEEKEEGEGDESVKKSEEDEHVEDKLEEGDFVDVGEEYNENDKADARDKEGHGKTQLRRSTREKKPAIGTPYWVMSERKGGRKRIIDESEALFKLYTTRCNEDEAHQYIVEMYGYHLTRAEVHCLRERAWINDRFMTMVAKTLVGDQRETYGKVSRHVFSADFMLKMVANPIAWTCEQHEKEILPQHIGYNLGEADLIFGPTLFRDHWFCYVLDTRNMQFHVLDSLVDNITYLKLQRQEEAISKGEKPVESKKKKSNIHESFKPKDKLASHCRDCFLKIITMVKPELLHRIDQSEIKVNWTKVHVQADTDSCGVHVLTWLQMWDGTVYDDSGHTMPKYSRDDLHEVKVGCLWWLATHRNNLHAHSVQSILACDQQTKRKK